MTSYTSAGVNVLFRKPIFIQLFWAASLIFLLPTFNSDKVSLLVSRLKIHHSEESVERHKYSQDVETESFLQIGDWIQVSRAINPYGIKACNFSFHSWSKYAAKSERKHSIDVQLWVWRKFMGEYASNGNIFNLFASRFLNSFGKDRTLLMIGDSHMEGQFLSLVCLLWSVNNTVRNLVTLQMEAVRKSIQYSPEYRPISFIRWDKFGDRKSIKGEKMVLNKELRVMPSVIVFGTGAHYSSIKYGSLQSAWSNFRRNFQHGLKLLCSSGKKLNSADIIIWKSATPHFFDRDLGKTLWKAKCLKGAEPSLAPHPAKKDMRQITDINKFAKAKGMRSCSSKTTTFKTLDVQDMSAQRRDAVCRETKYGTTDCSHFCRPGMPDWWNLELLEKLTAFFNPS